MQTEVLTVDALAPQAGRIARAAAVLRGGGLVAFPTETVYGLGALALDADAVGRIFAAKGRPANNPVIVHVADIAEAVAIAAEWPDAAERLARRFWPGPLTLIVPRGAAVPDVTTAGGLTVAIRVPAHPVALALLRAVGAPVAAPSANRSSELSPTRADHVLRGLDGRIDLVLDAGPTAGGIESTVFDVTTAPPRLLRPGLIGQAELEAVVGRISRHAAHTVGDALQSPGMLPRHYAPRTPLECSEDGRMRVAELLCMGARIGWLTWNESAAVAGLVVQRMPADPAGYAAHLYAALHALDDAGVDRIIVDLPPDAEAWLAVRDRLSRASFGERGA
ncbi:MAG TPA: threonylcarbamoyl-AMP synthase [Planctomycetales bacterium]|jgi:L-threonylcarbamoyladenylate synthase|nr:threonylcarbamoyl-AMP synthase [Planctomycetales bacterium]